MSDIKKEVAKQKEAKELRDDIAGFFGERDKTKRGEDGKVEDMEELSKVELKIKEDLYQDSLKLVSIHDDVQPMFNGMFVSARRNAVTTESGVIITDDAGESEYQEIQQVMAVGPQVQQCRVGMEVVVNFENYRMRLGETMAQKVRKDSELKIPVVTIDGKDYINVTERDIKYIIKK